MKRSLIISLICLLFSSLAVSQNEMDALRYAQIFPDGTARFASMGGAFGAIGGDITSLSINPAGIGIYRSSSFSVTPALNYNQANTRFFNNHVDDMKYSANLNNLGVVLAFPIQSPEQGGWQYVNMGFGINKHNNFNERWAAEGFNTSSSFMTSLLNQANREGHPDNFSDFSTGLAWDTWLIGEDDDGVFFVDMPDGRVMQRQEMNTSGAIREFLVSIGSNYNDRLYLGATFGFPTIRFKEESRYDEEDTENLSQDFNSLQYITNLKAEGEGFNMKVGAIFRVNHMIRLGAAFHSPTFFTIREQYNATMRSNLNFDYDTPESSSPEGRFEYELNTPVKAIGSLGLVFGNSGLISFDYEYTDYTNARLRSSDYAFRQENNTIREAFSHQHTIRMGGEINLTPLVIRGGYAYYSSPYKDGANDGSRTMLSGGIGFRGQAFFLDLGYTYGFYKEDYYLYDQEGLPAAQRDFTNSNFRATFGWRF